MCGIAGAVNLADSDKIVRKALRRMSHRGKDGWGAYPEKGLCFGHLLHSVVGKVRQPIVKDGFVFGANCEIYNWKELAKRHSFESKNDAELLLDLLAYHLKDKKPDEATINEALGELDGVFAFFLYNKKKEYLLIARDKIGEKPVWFGCKGKGFVFASEMKAIKEFSPEELNPRKIILLDTERSKLRLLNQAFFETSEKELDIDRARQKIKSLLIKAVEKRIPERRLGLLFSGGIDSSILAFILKKKNVDFTCYYTTCLDSRKVEKTAKQLGVRLRVAKIAKSQIKSELPRVIRLIETADPVKVEVALTMHFALKEAQKDNVKVIFSGVGADDLFGGYKRMQQAKDINNDSLSNMRRIYERDLYRDDVLSLAHRMELRLPYLDKALVESVLKVPSRHKNTEIPKQLLREIAENIGIKKDIAQLKRKAAQYDSGVHKKINEIIKENSSSRAGLFSQTSVPRQRLGALLSTGKDSIYAMHIQKMLNYDIACLITIKSTNKDSFMFHTPAIGLARLQSKALNLPLVMKKTEGVREEELNDLEKAIKQAKDRYYITGIVTGALFSNYQRGRIEKICDDLNLKVYSPLWHTDQETEMRSLIRQGYEFIFTKVAAEDLDASWLGRRITMKDVDRLVELNKKLGINVAGEGGEFESLVLDCPMFRKKIEVMHSKINKESENSATLIIKQARLVPKQQPSAWATNGH